MDYSNILADSGSKGDFTKLYKNNIESVENERRNDTFMSKSSDDEL